MSIRGNLLRPGALALVLTMWASVAAAQITTGSVTGTVTDAQGAVVPGALVVLVSESQGTKVAPVVTNGEGQYVLANVTADTYTVQVTLTGFRPISRKGVKVSGGDRVAVETLSLQVGGAQENVTVQAEAPVIQAATGNRSSVLQTIQLDSLPVASHTFLDYITTQVGVDASKQNQNGQRTGGGGQDNVMIDGISALDTGNNGLMGGMNLPEAAISEIKVLTSGYQAEYGRSSGLQVSAVTRSGTNRFRGGFYLYQRDSDWNSNSWANLANGVAKPVSKEKDWAYTIGGPIGKPGGDNKLFFFYTQEYRPRTSGNNTVNYRLPTELERRGDFSQTLDNNAALYNFIYDPSSGQPKANCSAAIQTACYQDGGVVGRIPTSKLYGPGMALLNQYPLPNNPQVQGTARAYNYTTTIPVAERLSYTPVIRVDYQATNNLRATWKFSGASERIVPGYQVNGQDAQGPLPNFTETINKFPLSFNTSATVNYTLTPTTFLEVTYGVNQNRLGTPNIGPLSNRNNVVCPADLAAQLANCSLGQMAYLFPDAGIVDPGYYEYGALGAIGTPFFEEGRILLPPQLNFGGTRIGNVPPSLNYPGWLNINRIQQGAASITKVMGNHTFKGGIYIENSYKAQNTGGNLTFQGALNVGVDTNNPFDSQMAFSNVALGVFSTYGQGSRFIEGNFHYWNNEGYIQDNWKVNRKLTLDYGMRFVHQGPYTDSLQQVANFFPEKWTKANAPLLYEAACPGNVNPCSAANRQAKDPRTGALLGTNTGSLIGQVIVGTGDFANGMVQAGNGISEAGYTWPSMVYGPRLGAAYDVTGRQQFVVRGSVGLYFDRPDGNTAFGTVANPPTATGLTQQWGRLADLQSSTLQFGPVPGITVNQYDSAVPKDTQWNLGVQYALPWSSSIDVSYVGHHQYDALAGTQNGNATNLNQIDVGTTLTAAGQDPTQLTPGTALNNNLLRSFRGYGNINVQTSQWTRTYHSLQTSWQRRFSDGFSFQANHTWSLSDKGNVLLPGPQLRLIHNTDGSYAVSPDQALAEDLFADQGTTTHIVVLNGTWDLPDLPSSNGVSKAVGLIVNDWQLSGIFRGDSGPKYDLGYSYNSGPTGQALTGSPDYTARIVLNDPAAFGSGCSSDQYAQLGNTLVPGVGASPVTTLAAAGPQVGSHGLESGRNLFTGCKNRILDLAIQRTIRLGGSRTMQLRADMYNAFNTVVYNGRQTQLQFNSTTDMTVRNAQYQQDGTMDPARTRPNQAGFGAANSARALRSVQFLLRFNF